MRSMMCSIIILFSLVCVVGAQDDCIQSVDRLNQKPIRTDTLVEINPRTHREKTFLSRVYIDVHEEGELGMDSVVRKDRKSIYYIRKKDCLMIQRIEIPMGDQY